MQDKTLFSERQLPSSCIFAESFK